MRAKNPKIKVQYKGIMFDLNATYSTKNGETKVDIFRVEAAKMVRQYIKGKYPKQFKSWVTSQSFSGGSALDVWLCEFNGSPIDDDVYQDIRDFAFGLKSGSFNGMTDSYDYSTDVVKSDLGTVLNLYTKYVSVNNRAKYGTKEDELNRLNKQ